MQVVSQACQSISPLQARNVRIHASQEGESHIHGGLGGLWLRMHGRLCDMAVAQEATKVSGARDAKAVQSEEDQRLERILARLREPLRDREMPQDPGAEPVCTASQVSFG